jgi:hypothetical protein
MRRLFFTALAGVFVLALSTSIRAQQIYGDYVETRTADVYTGPCVANGEVNLVGDQAILAWQVRKGEWNGVQLDGLSVVGVVKAAATLGDPYTNPYPAKAVMIVDERATDRQRGALISLAQQMSGQLLKNVVDIEAAPIRIQVAPDGGHSGKVSVHAGQFAGIETRSITAADHMCGNEVTFYPPLSEVTHAMAAVAELDQYNGPALNVSWTMHGKRSAFVGSFAR